MYILVDMIKKGESNETKLIKDYQKDIKADK